MKQTFLSILLMLLPILASADTVEIDGIWYNIIIKANCAEVTRNPNLESYKGSYSGDIVIPEKVPYDGVDYPVTKIGDNAFYRCSNLTSVTIPNSVTSFGDNAFWSCSNLTSVTIPNSVTSFGNNAFYSCSGLTSITIPNSITSIGIGAFSNCSSLTSVNIPNNVTSIYGTFSNCSGLTSVNIPNNVTIIGGGTFSDCSNLTSVTIGDKVSSIDSYAFGNCQQLSDVYCLAENVPYYTSSDAFKDSYIEYATLHVPAASLSNYSNAEPWKNFKNIVAIGSGEIPEVQKCATPTIKFENGVVKFSCATQGVEFVSTITPVGNNMKYDSEIVINNTYKVTVYATKAGYNNSDVATIEIQTSSSVKGDVDGNGVVNVADHVELSKIIMNQK